MTKVMRQAYAEVDEILKYMPKEYIDKVPMKFRKLFADCKLLDYEVYIDPDKSLSEQKVVYETLVIINILKYNFWCDSEEEKKEMLEKMKEFDRKEREKYDFSSLNRKNKSIEEVLEKDVKNNAREILPVKVENTSWFSKILLKIKNIFKR